MIYCGPGLSADFHPLRMSDVDFDFLEQLLPIVGLRFAD
jgi:hypothetical protein